MMNSCYGKSMLKDSKIKRHVLDSRKGKTYI